MSNHPYGLRGDPFASPATLSAKDASRLIRRRVRAFDGDGGALYPIDTCDLIHELAGGIPDAMLELAGKALRIAAAEGAPAVSPTHVRKAAKSAPVAEAAPVQAVAEVITRAVASPKVPDVAIAAWEDDPDLPPFHPAAFTLPAQPSEDLDANARDWVSRFIPASGAGPFAEAAASVAHAPTIHDLTAVSAAARTSAPESPAPTPPPSAAGIERAPAAVYTGLKRRRGSRPRGRRRRRHSGSQGFLLAVGAVCVIAFVVRMSMRGNLVPPWAGPARPVPTSAPSVETRGYLPEPSPAPPAPSVSEPAPTRAPAGVPPGFQEPAPTLRPPAPRTAAAVPTAVSGTAPASVEPARRAAPAAKFGLEVATFIFEERARVERDRLASAGLRARVVTTLEYGSRVYRVVISGYPHPAAAERAADSLLANAVILQARVVRTTSGQ